MTVPPDWPTDGAVLHRTTARVLPVRQDGRALLLHGWVPERPDEPFWFTLLARSLASGSAARRRLPSSLLRFAP